jgi:hypothetical protein
MYGRGSEWVGVGPPMVHTQGVQRPRGGCVDRKLPHFSPRLNKEAALSLSLSPSRARALSLSQARTGWFPLVGFTLCRTFLGREGGIKAKEITTPTHHGCSMCHR